MTRSRGIGTVEAKISRHGREVGALDNVLKLESHPEKLLDQVAADSPLVVEARGRGFFRALELRDGSTSRLPEMRSAERV